ncbi:GNAT family N-acetyltransferase [Limnovirga soli]|jgi:ElaA protein|uniref:Protein ElaA n=1 Tax=Limnovirga soli TaxID=2656915 RepID=A0A8J8FIU7_9BACT|nr:GNAT family N-acetyltransferase [Limnovirga soli]NNV56641.1 GNAT family N-acetyltransferase [Limnovirga soli]
MIHWTCTPFNALSVTELYEIMHLRCEVFVVEQNCPYQDADYKDLKCDHLCGWVDGNLAAYVRLVPPGVSYTEMSIGRVVTSPKYRKNGLGRQLMTKAIELCILNYGEKSIRIGAQQYLTQFYDSLGFRQCSDMYLEDNIPHIEMLYHAREQNI